MTVTHLLLVDDDPALLQALPEALRIRMGDDVRVDVTESGVAALNRIKEVEYDVIVSDIKMPGMDGLTLLEQIKQLRPATPTLLITGHGEHDLAVRALRAGAYDYVQKPIDRDYFVSSVKRAVQMRRLSYQVEAQRQALDRYATSLEQMVEERTNELVDAYRVKDEFLSIASHELRSPVVALKLYMHLSSLELEREGVSVPQHWERMRQAIERVEMRVNDLDDSVRIASGKLAVHVQRCDVRELCAQVAGEEEASTGREIALHMPQEPLDIEADVGRLSQVLTNLLANAIKYSPPGRPITVRGERAAAEAIITVTDRGPGIPPEHLPHIFERFYQVPGAIVETGSRVGLGLGLGLYIAREIVERHQGRIWAESVAGEGSSFHIALPLARGPARRRRSRELSSQVEQRSPRC